MCQPAGFDGGQSTDSPVELQKSTHKMGGSWDFCHMDPNKKKHTYYRWIQSLGQIEKTHFLGGGFNYFLFSPLLGEMIQFD